MRGVAVEQNSHEGPVRASEVISALSYALDLTEGQPMGHCLQTCLIGMRLAKAIRMTSAQQADLYYALLLKDAGCSSNASKLYHLLQSDDIKAKGDLKDKDWTRNGWESLKYAIDHVATGLPFLERVRALLRVASGQQNASRDLVAIRCERGASIARHIGFSFAVAEGIASLDEQWNGRGYPMGIAREEIPLLSRIMNLAQTLAVFWVASGSKAACDVMTRRSGRWFDPELVRAARGLGAALFAGLESESLLADVARLEPLEMEFHLDEQGIDNICGAFAEVIDAKSPFTFMHSRGVAQAAVAAGRQMGLPENEIVDLRRAALLHDIGKLSVPNTILEKPAKLDDAEWAVVRKHPFYTLEILKRVPGFVSISEVAAAHHEKLDGSGYFRGWGARQMNTHARILAVADIYDALAAARPYRGPLPRESVFSIMGKEAPHAIDADCLAALMAAPEAELNLPATLAPLPHTAPEPVAMPALAPQFA